MSLQNKFLRLAPPPPRRSRDPRRQPEIDGHSVLNLGCGTRFHVAGPPPLPLPDVLPGPRSTVSPRAKGDLTSRRHILVADEDPKIVEVIIKTLREDGHAVFHAYDGMSAFELAMALGDAAHLVISNTRVGGLPGVDLVYLVRSRLPDLPIMYIANINRSTPEIEDRKSVV